MVGAALLLSACGDTAGSTASPVSASAHTDSITITNFMFTPMSDSVEPGATIHVTNKDTVTHTMNATGGQFDTGDIAPGQTKTFRAPSHPGSYGYICNIHQYMTGTLTVK